jgi:hypothetical protein
LKLEIDFRDWLLHLARTQCRFILSDLIEEKQYLDKVAEGKFDFLRTTAAFRKAMDIAYKKYKWTIRSLI